MNEHLVLQGLINENIRYTQQPNEIPHLGLDAADCLFDYLEKNLIFDNDAKQCVASLIFNR